MMKFKDIRSLEDLQKARLKLERKAKAAEKSFSEKTDLGKILIRVFEKKDFNSSDRNRNLELTGYLLPVGISYVLNLFKKNNGKKKIRRLLIYSAIGSILALSAFQFLKKREPGTEE